jgi:hypothetical protein
MRRCMVAVALVTVLAACSSDALTAPPPIDHPPAQVGPWESYAIAPCASGIDHDIAVWRQELGDPVSITVRTGGDTTIVRVSMDAPAEYSTLYDGVVWQDYAWLPSWGYCMATRSIGLPDPYER